MRAAGYVKGVDPCGRVVIPKEIRDNLEIVGGTPLEVRVDGESIVYMKYIERCVFCGSISIAKEFKGKKICGGCLRDMEDKK